MYITQRHMGHIAHMNSDKISLMTKYLDNVELSIIHVDPV